MQDKYLTILDFDQAAELARKDPAAFERYRLEAIEALIARAPERTQLHLRRLQWRIEQVRKRSSNATDACVKLHHMMWNSFAGKGGLNETLERFNCSTNSKNRPLTKAKVLAFVKPCRTAGNSR
jgi:hypothetical protein